jgi:peroxiredoxin
LQESYDEFQKLDAAVVAVAQEDKDLATHAKFLKHFDPAPRFKLTADLEGKTKGRYHQTTTYLIDKTGHVREIFPMMVHHRASWESILKRIAEVNDEDR